MSPLRLINKWPIRLPVLGFSRGLKLAHFDRSLQLNAVKEDLGYCDLSILKRQQNHLIRPLSPSTALTSLQHFIREVKRPSAESTRKFQTPRHSKLESFFALLLYSLHYYNCPNHQRFITYQIENSIKASLESLTQESLLKKKLRIPSFNQKVSQLILLYKYGDTTAPSMVNTSSIPSIELKIIESSLLGLLEVVKLHDYEELLKWISCISGPSITTARDSLHGLYKIPDFIVLDILRRVPNSELELETLIYLSISSQVKLPFDIITSIIHHAKLLNYELLPNFINQIIHTQEFTAIELNKLIAVLAETQRTESQVHFQAVLNCQKLVFQKLQSMAVSLSTLGTLGVCLSLLPVAQSKAERLYQSIQHEVSTRKERQLSNIMRLKLSENPNHLVQNIDSMDHTDPKVWDEFIQLAEELSIINEENSLSMLQKYRNETFASHSAPTLQKLITSNDIIDSGSGLDNKSIATLLTKLYTNHSKPIGYFNSQLDYARYIFKIMDSPSRQIVGRVLVGESYINPQSSYILYRTLLAKYCNDEPNEKCLLSLIGPALRDSNLRWDSRFAAQIAVHEFRKHVKVQSSYIPSTRLLTPSSQLWCSYILLCGRSNYQDELAEVLPTWEALKFIPTRKALAMLLGALPLGVGERIKQHATTFLMPKGSTDNDLLQEVYNQYKWPTDSEMHYWREKMRNY